MELVSHSVTQPISSSAVIQPVS